MRIQINTRVFLFSVTMILAFLIYGGGFTENAATVFGTVKVWIETNFGWFYMLSVATFLVFAIWLGLSRYGSIRLGPDDSTPDYSYLSWFAMLFSAGMGIGLLYFSVAEPLFHFDSPGRGAGANVPGITPEQQYMVAKRAMHTTFFHWGLHAWGIYIIVALALGS